MLQSLTSRGDYALFDRRNYIVGLYLLLIYHGEIHMYSTECFSLQPGPGEGSQHL